MNASWSEVAKLLPISNVTLRATQRSATRPMQVSGSKHRFGGMTAAATPAAQRKAMAVAPATMRSRAGMGCSSRLRASPTRTSTSMPRTFLGARARARDRARDLQTFGRPNLCPEGALYPDRWWYCPGLHWPREGGLDPRAIPVVLRGARPPADAVGL